MSGDWREATFGALIDGGILYVNDGYRAKLEELGGDGLIFLRAGHVADSGIHFTGVERFHTSLTDRVLPKTSRPGDVIVTTKGNSTGRVAFVTNEMPPFVYSPHLSFWRSLDPVQLTPGFLRYWSRGAGFRRQLDGLKASTDMAPYLSLVDHRRLKITLPPSDAQAALARILGALDDKIELNRRMNETLEAMARGLFKSWFVDFDPVRAKAEGRQPAGMGAETAALFPDELENLGGREVPLRWEIGALGEVATIRRDGVEPSELPPDTPYIGLEHMPRGSVALDTWETAQKVTSTTVRFFRRDVLFGKLRPYFKKVGTAAIDGVCSSDILVIHPRRPQAAAFLLMQLSEQELIDYADRVSNGARMPRVSWTDLARFETVIPSVTVLAEFARQVDPVVERIAANIQESRTLAGLRDALLPKLLSGEICTRQAEQLPEVTM